LLPADKNQAAQIREGADVKETRGERSQHSTNSRVPGRRTM
jgi:hypothetical protein